jgi:hypothetical protein
MMHMMQVLQVWLAGIAASNVDRLCWQALQEWQAGNIGMSGIAKRHCKHGIQALQASTQCTEDIAGMAVIAGRYLRQAFQTLQRGNADRLCMNAGMQAGIVGKQAGAVLQASRQDLQECMPASIACREAGRHCMHACRHCRPAGWHSGIAGGQALQKGMPASIAGTLAGRRCIQDGMQAVTSGNQAVRQEVIAWRQAFKQV